MNTTNPGLETLSKVFFDADAARELLESIRWPSGAVCAHCGSGDRVYPLKPRKDFTRPVREGVHKYGACRKQFTVTVGTTLESTRVPLNKWFYAFQLMTCANRASLLTKSTGRSKAPT